MRIFTIGYGRRSFHDVVDLLHQYGITRLVDIRSYPYSRWNPPFRKKYLAENLPAAGIEYLWLGDALGAKALYTGGDFEGVLDLDWLEEQPWYQAGLDQIESAAADGESQAVLCAELRPEGCHRNWMVGASLSERGMDVLHIDEHGQLKTQAEMGTYE